METKVEAQSDSLHVASAVVGHNDADKEELFGGLTVGELIEPGAVGCKLLLHYELGDAASALAASGCTAAAVADGDGNIVGLLTENDLMRAYFEGALPTNSLGEWFDSGMARASDLVVQKLTVKPSTPVSEVAERMVANLVAGSCACHHVLVQEEDGRLCGIMSALDMVQALCSPEFWDDQGGEIKEPSPKSVDGPPQSKMTVKDVMKSRDDVFTCPPGNTMKDVLKVLLMTQQNSALVVDSRGIYGIVTPRDAVRAFSEGVPSSTNVNEWLKKMQPAAGPRLIEGSALIATAAATMTLHHLNHLVVVEPGTVEAIGVISSLDLALCAKARTPLLRAAPKWAGPTVGELVTQQWHLTAVCNKGATLREAATLLATSGRTSTALALSDETAPLRLLTENDIMRAFVYGWEPDATAESWLVAKLIPRSTVPQHVLVPPSIRLTEAAWLMVSAPKPGVDPCHHLVVKGVKGMEGGWLGVFSALDVARGLAGIDSELEAAKTGADEARVSVVMKTLEGVPTCQPTDTLKQALDKMISAKQNAMLVPLGEGMYDLVTPRCALQALAAGIPSDCIVSEFLASGHGMAACGGVPPDGPREITSDIKLLDAAAMMAERGLHHLLVQDPKALRPVGIISSLDLVRAVSSIRSQRPFASLGWLWACKGPATCTVW